MTLNPPIKHCKICFKEIQIDDTPHIFNEDICICASCQNEFDPLFIDFKIDQYKAVAIYEYAPFIRKLIYQYKGCFDYELCMTYLNMFVKELKWRYRGNYVIPAPSYQKDDERRGFNHVIEVFKQMGPKVCPIIEKIAHHKQAESNAKRRKKIGKYLKLKECPDLSNRRVLIVDDIYTTGSTIRNMIYLVEKLNPKAIKVLVLAKTRPKTKHKN